jgi:hypothetical protein
MRHPASLLALVLAACSAPEGPLQIEVGTGDARFVQLEEGGSVPLTCGGQGGQHVWTSVRLQGRGVDHPAVRVRLLDERGEVVCGNEFARVGTTAVDGWWELSGLICQVYEPEKIIGTRCAIEGQVSVEGESLSAVRHVTLTGFPCR